MCCRGIWKCNCLSTDSLSSAMWHACRHFCWDLEMLSRLAAWYGRWTHRRVGSTQESLQIKQLRVHFAQKWLVGSKLATCAALNTLQTSLEAGEVRAKTSSTRRRSTCCLIGLAWIGACRACRHPPSRAHFCGHLVGYEGWRRCTTGPWRRRSARRILRNIAWVTFSGLPAALMESVRELQRVWQLGGGCNWEASESRIVKPVAGGISQSVATGCRIFALVVNASAMPVLAENTCRMLRVRTRRKSAAQAQATRLVR